MASENDTWIGRLFSRIKPGSSYAAFPWKSWSKICLILETIKGIGCRINRTRSGQNWSIELVDEDGFPARPHAYQVHVRNPDISVEDYESGDYDDLKVYCYMPVSFPMCGANGPNPNGGVGDTIGSGEGYPESFSWGWHLLEEETNSEREFYVVGEVAVEDWEAFTKNGTGPTFENIQCMSPQDVNTRLDPGNFDQKRWLVPIAYVNNDRVVQLLCGRPNMWMEVPDGDTTPEDGANEPGRSIQRVPGGDGESGGSGGGGQNGMLELYGFHDPDTMTLPEPGGSASAALDDLVDIVVRDKTSGRRRVNYARPSAFFQAVAGTYTIEESSGGSSGLPDCVARRYVFRHNGASSGSGSETAIDIPAPPEYDLVGASSGCSTRITLKRKDCGDSSAASAGSVIIPGPIRYRLVKAGTECAPVWKLQLVDCSGSAADDSGSDNIELPVPPEYTLTGGDSGGYTKIRLKRTECGESSGSVAGEVSIEKPRRYRIDRTSASSDCTQTYGLKVLSGSGTPSDASGSSVISIPVPEFEYVKSIDSISITPNGVSLGYTVATRKGCTVSEKQRTVEGDIPTTECTDDSSSAT